MAPKNPASMSFLSFGVNGGKLVEGVNAPYIYKPGNHPRRGVILGARQRNIVVDRDGREHPTFKPLKGSQTLLGSQDSPPEFRHGRFVKGSVETIGRQHFITAPAGDGKHQILVQTGLPTNPRIALEVYDRLQREGKLPTAHGYLIDDGTLEIASVEADESVTIEGETVPTGLRGLVKHIKWAVSRDRVPTTDIPIWREDYLYASPGAEIYVFGAYGEMTRLVLQQDGTLRQEESVSSAARQRFDEQETKRIAKRKAEKAEREAKKAQAVGETPTE